MAIKLNTDEEQVKRVRKALKETGGYCPCVIPPYTEDDKCMCKQFREQTSEGLCHCGLYIKEEK